MILVTGGTGLLGSHLLLELVRQHEEVIAVKRPSSDLEEVKKVFARHSGEADALFGRIDWVDLNLEEGLEVERAMIDVDRVYHCAAQVSFHPRDDRQMIAYNVRSTENVVNACLATGGKRLLHVSSSSAIGSSPDETPAHEGLIWSGSKSHTPYSVSKFQSEMMVWRGMEEGLEALIVNPTIILGAGFWERGSSALFDRVAGGMKYSTNGKTGYVGVYDVVMAMTGLMESDLKGERFILSSGNYTYAAIMEMIALALGSPRSMKLLSPSSLRWLARLDASRGLLTGKRKLTSIQAKAAFNESTYSSDKVSKALAFEFTPVEKVVEDVCAFYLVG
jgi:dihydroflavonol-4-reductase